MHFHMLLLDGVYVADGDSVRWVPVPPPTTEEVQEVVTQIAWTVERWLGTQGYAADEPCEEDQDDDANGVLLSASVAGRVALGVRAGAKVRRLQRASTRPFRLPALCAGGVGPEASRARPTQRQERHLVPRGLWLKTPPSQRGDSGTTRTGAQRTPDQETSGRFEMACLGRFALARFRGRWPRLRVWWTPHAPRRRSTTGDARRAQQPRTVGKTSRPRTAIGRTRCRRSRPANVGSVCPPAS